MSRKDRAIIRKRSRGKCGQPNTIEAEPTPPSILASPVPLTNEALRLLNRNTEEHSKSSDMVLGVSESVTSGAPSGPSISAYDPEYQDALEDRDIFFADGEDPPADFHELWEAMLQPRESPGPDDIEAETFRAELDEAKNPSASVQDILLRLVSLSSLRLGKDTAFVKDQLWRRDIALQPDLQPTLTTPKPYVSIGWKPAVFKSRYKKAYRSLEAFISPIAGFKSVAWPIFTIGARGDGGSMRAARLQNLHNGAVMLSNLFELKRKCGNEEPVFNKVHVIGVELTAESVQLSCYWAYRNDIGIVEYFGKSLQSWSLFDATGESLRNARRGIRNVVEWIKPRIFEWIQSDMAAFEVKNEQILHRRSPQLVLSRLSMASTSDAVRSPVLLDINLRFYQVRSRSYPSQNRRRERERVSVQVQVAFSEGKICKITSAFPWCWVMALKGLWQSKPLLCVAISRSSGVRYVPKYSISCCLDADKNNQKHFISSTVIQ